MLVCTRLVFFRVAGSLGEPLLPCKSVFIRKGRCAAGSSSGHGHTNSFCKDCNVGVGLNIHKGSWHTLDKNLSSLDRRSSNNRRHWNGSLPREGEGKSYTGFVSQREQYNQFRDAGSKAVLQRDGVAAAVLSPLPRSNGYYDGMDADAVGSCPVSREERRERLRQALEEQAVSVLDICDGGEDDIELNGLPESEFHGQGGWTSIASDSALYSAVLSRSELGSRRRMSSWGAVVRRSTIDAPLLDQMGDFNSFRNCVKSTTPAAAPSLDLLSAVRRRARLSEAGYSNVLEGELLSATLASVSQPRSVYALRKLYVDGLTGYQGVISRAEEAAISNELLQLLQDRHAAYIAEESRYCVNLYERELGVPGKDTLAFALARAPTLQQVLYRFFLLGLIPAPPNVCQVSEMIGAYAGYPVHRKPRAIGSYYGILNLISPSVIHMQHNKCPWFPRLYVQPRSLFVVSEPCLCEYSMGYKFTHQPFHTFDYATRVSKDYRLEVVFALVETENMPRVYEAVRLTDYARSKADKDCVTSVEPDLRMSCAIASKTESTDAWLQKTRAQMHHGEVSHSDISSVESGREVQQHFAQHCLAGCPVSWSLTDSLDTPRVMSSTSSSPCDKKEAFLRSLSSHSPPSSSTSPARRRLAALKARHDFTMQLQRSSEAVQRGSDAVHVIRGHTPADDAGLS